MREIEEEVIFGRLSPERRRNNNTQIEIPEVQESQVDQESLLSNFNLLEDDKASDLTSVIMNNKYPHQELEVQTE